MIDYLQSSTRQCPQCLGIVTSPAAATQLCAIITALAETENIQQWLSWNDQETRNDQKMCKAIGVKLDCGCAWTLWVRDLCTDSRCRFADKPAPPFPDVSGLIEAQAEVSKGYYRVSWCCSGACCERVLADEAEQVRTSQYATRVGGVVDHARAFRSFNVPHHLTRCIDCLAGGLGMSHSMSADKSES